MNARPVTAVSTGLLVMIPANVLPPTSSLGLRGYKGCTHQTRDGLGFVGQEKVLPRLSKPEPLPVA